MSIKINGKEYFLEMVPVPKCECDGGDPSEYLDAISVPCTVGTGIFVEEEFLNQNNVVNNRYVNATSIVDKNGYKALEIDTSVEKTFTLRITNYTTTATPSIWTAKLDQDGNVIANTRTSIAMWPLKENGTIDYTPGYSTTNYSAINSKPYGVGYECTVEDNVSKFVLFNMSSDDIVELSVTRKVEVKEMTRRVSIDNLTPDLKDRINTIETITTPVAFVEVESPVELITNKWVSGDSIVDKDGSSLLEIDTTTHKRFIIRVKSYTLTGDNDSIWSAQIDGNGDVVANSRTVIAMYPLRDDDSLYIKSGTSTTHYNAINTNQARYQYGMGVEIIVGADVSKFVLFNYSIEDSIDISVSFIADSKERKVGVDDIHDDLRKTSVPYKFDYERILRSQDYIIPLANNIALAAKAHMTDPNCLCIVEYTDTHYEQDDSLLATAVARRLAELTNASAIINIGDLIHCYNNGKAESLAIAQEQTRILHGSAVPYLQVKGNHDDCCMYNRKNNLKNADDYITTLEFFNNTTQKSRRDIVLGNKAEMYYYVDDEDSKTRIIILNDHSAPETTDEDGNRIYDNYAGTISSLLNDVTPITSIRSIEQFDWFVNTALDLPADWGVIVFSHYGVNNNWGFHLAIKAFKDGTMLSKYNATDEYNIYDYSTVDITTDFSTKGARRIIYFNGESHQDLIDNTYSYQRATFLNSSIAKDFANAPYRETGKPTETAVSVLIANPNESKITELRFGARIKNPYLSRSEQVSAGDSNLYGVYDTEYPLTEYDNYRVFEW